MLGKRDNHEKDKHENNKPKKYTKLSLGDSICDNKNIITFKSNPCTLVCFSLGSISINEDRNLFSFGKNFNGFLGHKEINEIIYPPKQISNLMNIKMVDCGYFYTVCIDYDGNLFSFGDNRKGQLGIGKERNEVAYSYIPQQIIGIPPINYISCGHKFTICISNDTTLYSFGECRYGQLGLGDNNLFSLSPQLIPDLNDVELVTCGESHSICKTYSNEYYSWGGNRNGQLGHGKNDFGCSTPHKCLNWPDNIIGFKSGNNHSLLLTSTGYIYSFGSNYSGQLGLNDVNIKSVNIPTLIKDIPLIKQIECGGSHSICIDINDKLWIFGGNSFGQLGLGDREKRYKPTLNESLHDIADIAPRGLRNTFIKTINNEIFAFGYNKHSQLGIKTPEANQLTPIQVFKDTEDIWASNTKRSKQKSARK